MKYLSIKNDLLEMTLLYLVTSHYRTPYNNEINIPSIKAVNDKINKTLKPDPHYSSMCNSPSSYSLGCPVFLSGSAMASYNNYKNWSWATKNDSTNCMCSVKPEGTWKTFVGIITNINTETQSLTFASSGAYLFTVDDSSLYNVGDSLLYDGRILDEDIALTLKIQSSMIGVVSSIIDSTTLSMFK